MSSIGIWVSGSLHVTEEMISDYEFYLTQAEFQPIDVPATRVQLAWYRGYQQALEDVKNQMRSQSNGH